MLEINQAEQKMLVELLTQLKAKYKFSVGKNVNALGLGPIYDVMVGGQKTTPAMTSLFSFITALKTANPSQVAAIDTLTSNRGVVTPIADAYGTGETHNGGHSENLPLYRTLIAGTAQTVTLFGGAGNELGQNRYFRFAGDGASHTVSITTATGTVNDVDVYVFLKGDGVVEAAGSTGTETTPAFTAVSGTEYIIVVTGYGSASSYTTSVKVN